jgi:hypothetical protein
LYYTDTLTESILVICKNPKHNINTDIQKMVDEKEEGKISTPANAPKPQPAMHASTMISQRRSS